MAFVVQDSNNQNGSNQRVELVINIGESCYKFAVPRIRKSQLVRAAANSKKDDEDAEYCRMFSIVVDKAEVLQGGKTIYEVMDMLDDKTEEDLMQYVVTLATSSVAALVNNGERIL